MLDQALLLHLRQRGERLRDCTSRRGVEAPDPKVHDIKRIDAEIFKILVHGLSQVVGRQRRGPSTRRVAARPDLGHDPQIVWVWVERLIDDLVSDVRAVVVAGVDVGDAKLDDLAQHGDRRI